MSDLPSNVDTNDASSLSINSDQTNLNNPTNDTLNSFDSPFTLSYDTMRVLFIAIATITVLICLTICITVCICICLKRRRKSKHHGKKDKLLPEQSKKSSKISANNLTTTNGKQGSSIQQAPIKSFYYDTLDDIPFIDESRPTSVVDITHV